MRKLFANEKIIETEGFSVHQDWEVPIPAFFILEAKRKLRSVSDFTTAEAQDFISLLVAVRKGMEEELGIKDVYLFQNEDTEHNFHFWIFPRYSWMERFGRKIQSVRPIMQYAKDNMVTDNVIREVKDNVKRMKEYLTTE